MCLFCQIIKGEIPSDKVYENDKIVIIKDIVPQCKRHYLMIPKEHFADITEMTNEQAHDLADSFMVLATLTDKLDLKEGFRLVSNKGVNGCQSVGHFHVHILGGEKLKDRMC